MQLPVKYRTTGTIWKRSSVSEELSLVLASLLPLLAPFIFIINNSISGSFRGLHSDELHQYSESEGFIIVSMYKCSIPPFIR